MLGWVSEWGLDIWDHGGARPLARPSEAHGLVPHDQPEELINKTCWSSSSSWMPTALTPNVAAAEREVDANGP